MEWDDFKAAIKNGIDIVALISRDVHGLRRSGSVWRGAPEMDSLIVWPETWTWRRFSTGKGGDGFSWLMEHRGLTFIEAARELAEIAGVDIPRGGGDDVEDDRRAVFRALTAAAARMHRQLPGRVRAFLRSHYGFTDETIDSLLIGWADGGLWEALGQEGIDEATRLSTGLFVPRKIGDPHEIFEHRIVFPYWLRGQVVYMIARRTEHTGDEPWQLAKYKKLPVRSDKHDYVSPWVSNDVFYNEDAAARSVDALLVTEGVTDCIAAWQAGIPTISPVTTRFRDADLPKLRALTAKAARVVLCNDAEPPKDGRQHGAGLAGALSTATALWPARDVRIAMLPREDPNSKIDVNEFLRDHDGSELVEIMKRAPRLPEWMVQQIPDGLPLDEAIPLLDDALRAALPLTELERAAIIERAASKVRAGGKRAIRARLLELEKGEANDKTARPRISGEIHAASTHYYAVGKDGQPTILSSFVIDVEHRVVMDGVEMIAGAARIPRGRVERLVFPPGAWSGRRQLVTALGRMSPDLQWTGGDDHVQGLLALLSAEDVPVLKGTDTIGWTETPDGPVWVTPDGVIGDHRADIVYVNDGNPLDSRLDYPEASEEEVRRVARVALPAILEMNDPSVTIPVVGWFFASVFRRPLMHLLGHFPGLFVWGSPGCGKTSTLQQMCRMFGIAGAAEPHSATETEFSMLRLLSGTNGAPVWFDEYKPSDMPARSLMRLHRFLRRLYAGERESRGRSDQTVRSYHLQAPVIVSGESRPEEQALAERSLIASPSKSGLQRQRAREAFSMLQGIDSSILARPIVERALRADVRADLARSRELLVGWLDARLPNPRVTDGLITTVFGMLQWEMFADSLGVDIPDVEPLMPSCIQTMLGEVSPIASARDDLDRFLEQCAMLANAGHIESGKHFVWEGGILWVYLRGMLQIYLERRRAAGAGDDTNGLRALSRLARENHEAGGYVHEVSGRVTIGGRQARCLGVDPDKVPDDIDLDGFGMTPGGHVNSTRSAWD